MVLQKEKVSKWGIENMPSDTYIGQSVIYTNFFILLSYLIGVVYFMSYDKEIKPNITYWKWCYH